MKLITQNDLPQVSAGYHSNSAFFEVYNGASAGALVGLLWNLAIPHTYPIESIARFALIGAFTELVLSEI